MHARSSLATRPTDVRVSHRQRKTHDGVQPMAHSHGAERLLRDMPSNAAVKAGLDALAQWTASHPAHPQVEPLEQALGELAWLRQSGEGLGDWAVESLLSDLVDGLAGVEQGALSQPCGRIRSLVTDQIELCLRTGTERAGRDPYAKDWVAACAELFLANEGGFDASVCAALRALLDAKGAAGLVPPRMRQEGEFRLRQWISAESGLQTLAEGLLRTKPLHPEMERLRRLQFAGSKLQPKRQLSEMLLAFVLTAPRQPEGLGICWLTTRNRDIHLRLLDRLLGSLADWFERGHLAFWSEAGARDRVVPKGFAVHALRWANEPVFGWDRPNSECLELMVQALQAALPGQDEGAWIALLQAEGQALYAQLINPTPLLLLRGALMRHLNLSRGWRLSEKRLHRAQQSPLLRERAAFLEACVEDCLMAIEARQLNLLTAIWQVTASTHWKQGKLAVCWEIVEASLLNGLDLDRCPPGMANYLAQLQAAFLSCADLQFEFPAGAGDAGLRLHLKLPGDWGQVKAIRSARQLAESVQALSRDVVKRHARTDFARCQAVLKPRLADGQRLAEQVRLRSGDIRHEATEDGGVWFLSTGTDERGDLAADPSQDIQHLGLNVDVESDHFVRINLPGQAWYWQAVSVEDGKTSSHAALVALIQMLKRIERSAFTRAEFHATLEAQHGCVDIGISESSDFEGGHAMTFTPLHGSFRSAWTTDVAPEQWIREQLVEPMQRGLRVQLTRAQAQRWLNAVLGSCALADGVKAGAAAQWALQLALGPKAGDQEACNLDSLVNALRAMLAASPQCWFRWGDPLLNGLSLAVINHLPFKVPVAIYGDPGWERSSRLLFCNDPVAQDIGHFKGNESANEAGIELVGPEAPGIF